MNYEERGRRRRRIKMIIRIRKKEEEEQISHAAVRNLAKLFGIMFNDFKKENNNLFCVS